MSEAPSNSLRYFELLSLAALALGVIVSGLEYRNLSSDPEVVALGGGAFVVLIQFFVLLLCAGLILLISRKKSKIAKWIWVILFIVGLPMYIPHLAEMFEAGFAGTISSLQFLTFCGGLYFLFQSDARDAFRR
jgi:hypothetical protein